jgi:hypothetical protein
MILKENQYFGQIIIEVNLNPSKSSYVFTNFIKPINTAFITPPISLENNNHLFNYSVIATSVNIQLLQLLLIFS